MFHRKPLHGLDCAGAVGEQLRRIARAGRERVQLGPGVGIDGPSCAGRVHQFAYTAPLGRGEQNNVTAREFRCSPST